MRESYAILIHPSMNDMYKYSLHNLALKFEGRIFALWHLPLRRDNRTSESQLKLVVDVLFVCFQRIAPSRCFKCLQRPQRA